jgi:single-strand DNA-binding protein
MQDTQVHMTGYLAADPRWKKVAGDISTARLRVASTARWRNRETGEWADGATTFVNVQCWRTLADNVSVCLRKGEPVMVSGRLHIRRYEDREGNPKTAVEIEASAVGHDLGRGVALFSRIRRPAPGLADGHPADGADGAGVPSVDGEVPMASAPVPGGGAAGGGVIDERAVADFARQVNAELGPDAPDGAGLAAGGPEAVDLETEDPEDDDPGVLGHESDGLQPAGSPA